MPQPGYITLTEAAKLTGFTVDALKKGIRRGEIPEPGCILEARGGITYRYITLEAAQKWADGRKRRSSSAVAEKKSHFYKCLCGCGIDVPYRAYRAKFVNSQHYMFYRTRTGGYRAMAAHRADRQLKKKEENADHRGTEEDTGGTGG